MAKTFDSRKHLTSKNTVPPKGDKHQVKIKDAKVVFEDKNGEPADYILIVMEYANEHVTPARFYSWDILTVERDIRTVLNDYMPHASSDELIKLIIGKELTVWQVNKDGYLKYRFVEPVIKTETTEDDENNPF